ncbi:MAG: hypothetical protein ABIZ72_08160 [Candidatus Limnocylindrales bacterium]
MTADRRLRIGGWAALLVAIVAPIEVAVAFLTADRPGSLDLDALSAVEIVRFGALLVAVVGLDPLFRSLAPDLARPVRFVGAVAALALIATDVVGLAVGDLGAAGMLLNLVGSVLVGIWFIGSGAIVMSRGGAFARIGWTAELGGLGMILAGVASALRISGPTGGGMTWIEWFEVLGLFVVVYLVRVWSYVVRGRLPGPGIL